MPRPINKIRVGITMGDPSGVGPEIVAAALRGIKDKAEFIVIGDSWVFKKAKLGSLGEHKFIDLANVRRRNFRFG
ncbi:MAG: hypothetical protein V2A59_00855, partial [Candidatus Omnitrophota bacterium]